MNFINPDLEFFEENRDCSYFEDQKSDMRYRFLNSCSIEEYQKKLERGWRRFGKIHFVPECKSCTKCVSMRIDVKNFQFSKSQKRVIAKMSLSSRAMPSGFAATLRKSGRFGSIPNFRYTDPAGFSYPDSPRLVIRRGPKSGKFVKMA